MLRTFSLSAPIRLERSEFRRVLKALHEKGWIPAGLAGELAFADQAGVPHDVISETSLLDQERRTYPFRSAQVEDADVFFRDKDMYAALSRSNVSRPDFAFDPFEDEYQNRPEEDRPDLQLILVTEQEDAGLRRLSEFAEVFEESIKLSVDGRKTRHMVFAWSSPPSSYPLLDQLTARFVDEGSQVAFEVPSLDEATQTAVQTLAEHTARQLARDFGKAGFARERDVLARRAADEEQLRNAIEQLTTAAVVDRRFLLECRETGSPLTQLNAPDQLHEPAVGDLRCPACDRRFGDELLTHGYSLSEVGRQLISSSKWMTVRVVIELANLGLPLDSLRVNLEESGEEVDLIMEVFGELWIFELKDREFGAGDAHALNYRRVRYRADKTLIVTTERVALPARRVFEELASQDQERGARSRTAIPIYVEGLENLRGTLDSEIAQSAVRHAYRQLYPVSASTGFSLMRVFQTRFS